MYVVEMAVENIPTHPWLSFRMLPWPVMMTHPGVAATRLVQLCPYPSISLRVPIGVTDIDFKRGLADLFYDEGCEQPVASTVGVNGKPIRSSFIHSVNVNSLEFVRTLLAGGHHSVILQDFGMKRYMTPTSFESILGGEVQDIASPLTAIDVGKMKRDQNHIYLFGLPVSNSGMYVDRAQYLRWRVYPLCPMLQQSPVDGAVDDNYIFGSVEAVDAQGRLFSVGHSVVRLYPLLHHFKTARSAMRATWPTAMYHMQTREATYKMLAEALSQHTAAQRAGGYRIECRAVSRGADNLAACADMADTNFDYAKRLMEDGILRIKKVPIAEFVASVAKSVRQCDDMGIWTGMRSTGPSDDDVVVQHLFQVKRLQFCLLQAQLGIATGRTVDTLVRWIRSQRPERSDGDWLRATAVRHPQLATIAVPVPASPVGAIDPMEPLLETRRRRAARFLGRLPSSPRRPGDIDACPRTAPDPGQATVLPHHTTDDVELVCDLVGAHRNKGGGFFFTYLAPWGKEGGSRPRSKGYMTMEDMGRAILSWAGDEWSARVKHDLKNVPDVK